MGDPDGNAQGGFLILDQDLKVCYAGLLNDDAVQSALPSCSILQRSLASCLGVLDRSTA